MRLWNWILANKLLIAILVFAFFFRVFRPAELFNYSHDNDLAGWFVRDVVFNHHPRLIGQETSTSGIFIGPLFYYLQIPFYALFRMDPIGGVLLVALLGVFSVWSVYYVFSKIWSKNVGLIGAFIYAVSFYTTFNDREVVPTMPVMLWTVWYFYTLWLFSKGKQKFAWPLLGVLLGLIWHLNFALVLLVPLIIVVLILGKRKLDIKSVLYGILVCFIISLPLIIFETRHNFQQTHSLFASLTTDQHDIVSGYAKWERTFLLASKDLTNLLWGSLFNIKYELTHFVLLSLFVLIIFKKIIDKKTAFLMTLWLTIYIAFFSLYSKILSEYYLNGMVIVWIAILSVGITYLLNNKKTRKIGIVILTSFAIINLYRFFTIPVNKVGYSYRKAIVSEIKRDSEEKEYPCISISYITNPGYELGYRYFFWLENMHVNNPNSGSPVYTIVFPLKPIFKEDKSFGSIGLIYPNYTRYTKESVEESCKGANSNLTDPLFGYTE